VVLTVAYAAQREWFVKGQLTVPQLPECDEGQYNIMKKRLILFNKPCRVLSQFTSKSKHDVLANYISIKEIYVVGRLDYESEGLLLLTNCGILQHIITDPQYKLPKTYWVQVEGIPSKQALSQLAKGVNIKGRRTQAAQVSLFSSPPCLWPRNPPIRQRKFIPTTWMEISITEGRNRQIRRMTASVGYPTLRLIRYAIGDWSLDDLQPGQFNEVEFPFEWLKGKQKNGQI